ncbi:hypothetical protein L9F63_005953 [Diploptera punctata]|uniref:Uncharacterized protein n=1 Tax=Diploptera punctata TaxID=6984 RepID=A0AAD8E5N1_DIPPU|nr:hypothetical protein L9F63_005953 [Diploptera punctata]
MLFSTVIFLSFSCISAKLPHYIKPCARSNPNFNECALKHANENIKELVKVGQETEVNGTYILENIGGKSFLKTVKPQARLTSKRMYLRFENLFNGNKLLEDQMNKFLDANWKDVYEELTEPGTEVMLEILISIINKIHMIAPFEEMFPEKLP